MPKILSLCCLDLLYAKFDDAPLRPDRRGSTSLQLLPPRENKHGTLWTRADRSSKIRAWKATERGAFFESCDASHRPGLAVAVLKNAEADLLALSSFDDLVATRMSFS